MTQTARLMLVFIAAAIGALFAPDVFDILPLWLQVTAGALSAGLAGVGVIPPQYADRTNEVETIAFDHPVVMRDNARTHEPYPSEVGAKVITRQR